MDTFDYDAQGFDRVFKTELGQNLWSYLTSSETRIRMQTATALGRPAVEGIEEQLLEQFGSTVQNDRIKQMIGHMVRQIMERDGYVIDAQNVKVTNGAPFVRATRYRARGFVRLHVWRSLEDPRFLALTLDRKGAQLERTDSGHWRYWKTIEGRLRLAVSMGLTEIDATLGAIEKDGYATHCLDRMMRTGRESDQTPTRLAESDSNS
ncbi:hypothetical protein [Massilia putida]|uniref:hypothetical protein n=1 Tax=Massilia putida TaxID=1141883 RepID=UPI000951713F|nr:hypothetical protein [Massilia putida]